MKLCKPKSFKLFLIRALILMSIFLMTQHALAEEAQHDSQHTFHKNIVGVFVGITDEDRRERALTLAFEYERRLNEKLGIGLVVERAFGDLDFNVYIAGVAYHAGPWRNFLVRVLRTLITTMVPSRWFVSDWNVPSKSVHSKFAHNSQSIL